MCKFKLFLIFWRLLLEQINLIALIFLRTKTNLFFLFFFLYFFFCIFLHVRYVLWVTIPMLFYAIFLCNYYLSYSLGILIAVIYENQASIRYDFERVRFGSIYEPISFFAFQTYPRVNAGAISRFLYNIAVRRTTLIFFEIRFRVCNAKHEVKKC